jgi:hypothetical protein
MFGSEMDEQTVSWIAQKICSGRHGFEIFDLDNIVSMNSKISWPLTLLTKA